MTSLAKLQHTFQNSVLNPNNLESITWVSASGRADPETQLSIYSYAYAARLKEVLANDFPALLNAIGEDHFNQLANDYITAHPSHYFSLRDFGSQLPPFIAGLIQKGQKWKNLSWAYELAVFEWTLGLAFNAADANCVTEQDITNIPPDSWPELTFTLHPSIHRLDFEWNIPEMWQALTNDPPTEVTALQDSTSPWLVWREQLVTRYRSMQTAEQLAFDKMAEGASFNEVCETLIEIIDEEDVPLHAAMLLKGWVSQGLISTVK